MGELQVTPRHYTPYVEPRCVSRDGAAAYLNISTRQVDRLIQAGQLPVVRLPVERNRHTQRGETGVNRRILIDVTDLNRLIDASKERT